MTTSMAATTLRSAKALIADPENWCQHALKRDGHRRCAVHAFFSVGGAPPTTMAGRVAWDSLLKASEERGYRRIGCMEHYGATKPGVLGKLAREMSEPIRAALTALDGDEESDE
jgi:hypothetical protein